MELRLDTTKLALFAALALGGLHFAGGDEEASDVPSEVAAALEALKAAQAATPTHEPVATPAASEEASASAAAATPGPLAPEITPEIQPDESAAEAEDGRSLAALMAQLERDPGSADDMDASEWEALFAEMSEAGAFGASEHDFAMASQWEAAAVAQWTAMLQQAAAQGWQGQAPVQNHGWSNSLLGSGTWDGRWGGGNSPADPWLNGGMFTSNSLTGTAVSTSGDSGYIALGNGGFVSW